MKLFLLPLLITSTLCYKAIVKESSGKGKTIQGDYDKCINEKGAAVGIQAPKGVEVLFYKDTACKNHWFLRAWGGVAFDKAYDYNSVMLASLDKEDSGSEITWGSDSGYVVTNNN